jgi:hypothetical protein
MVKIDFEMIGYDAEGEPQYGVREMRTMNRVIHTTRKQELLKEITDLVGYTKRIVHVIPAEEVQLVDTQWAATSRVRYRCVNLSTMEMIPIPQREGAKVKLNLAMAIIASTVQDGRELPLTVYIRPENVKAAWLNMKPDDLSWADMVVLSATKHYKSVLRIAEAHNICALGEAEYKVSKQRLQDRGLLDAKGAITILGLNVVGATTLYELAQQRPTHPHTPRT